MQAATAVRFAEFSANFTHNAFFGTRGAAVVLFRSENFGALYGTSRTSTVRSMVYIAVGGVFMNARGSYAIFAPICTSNAQRLYMHSVGAVRHGVLWYVIMCGMVCFVMVSYAMLSYGPLCCVMACYSML